MSFNAKRNSNRRQLIRTVRIFTRKLSRISTSIIKLATKIIFKENSRAPTTTLIITMNNNNIIIGDIIFCTYRRRRRTATSERDGCTRWEPTRFSKSNRSVSRRRSHAEPFSFLFFYRIAVSKRFSLVVGFNEQFFRIHFGFCLRENKTSLKKKIASVSRGADDHSTSGECLGLTIVFNTTCNIVIVLKGPFDRFRLADNNII